MAGEPIVDYKKAAVITVLLVLAGFLTVKWFDDNKLASLTHDVQGSVEDLDSTRLLSLYGQTFANDDPAERCKLIELSTKKQIDRGFYFVDRLKKLEDANLLADYEDTRRQYFLSNVELWLYTTQSMKECGSQMEPIIFFHNTRTYCPDCIVQGQILDQMRGECTNIRIITLANDLDIDVIELIKHRYNVTEAPSLVIGNEVVKRGLTKKEEILSAINCEKPVTMVTP